MIRVLGSGHYPDDFIRLSEIKNLRFHNVNYREYLSVWGDWIIGVYPFAVNITSIYKRDGSLIGYDDFLILWVRFSIIIIILSMVILIMILV